MSSETIGHWEKRHDSILRGLVCCHSPGGSRLDIHEIGSWQKDSLDAVSSAPLVNWPSAIFHCRTLLYVRFVQDSGLGRLPLCFHVLRRCGRYIGIRRRRDGG